MQTPSDPKKFLSIDIGGSHIKATVLDQEGKQIKEYEKIQTPSPASPENLMQAIKTLTKDFPAYDLISAGFPGYVKDGTVFTAPNLGTDLWRNTNLKKLLKDNLGKDAIVVNDADMQGMGVIGGKGFEMVITLGTGFGTALFFNGKLLPHLELAHLQVTKSKTYDVYLGDKALHEIGAGRWNKRAKKVLDNFNTVFNYDFLYIGGGNASKIDFKLEGNVKIVSNREGIKGGPRLWQQDEKPV
ncbi:ROK family protein [uncultured Mucilaginibacter sp.]|uniref:ROK family protein n=1 Tax=uncultured Mucilaginibacter sp. TaxID=797541 RepID=UPI00262FCA96|nr:ROK family protein [uncultured Mucilaginibacter sp.]